MAGRAFEESTKFYFAKISCEAFTSMRQPYCVGHRSGVFAILHLKHVAVSVKGSLFLEIPFTRKLLFPFLHQVVAQQSLSFRFVAIGLVFQFIRVAPYDRSCLKADIRRAPTELLLEIEAIA
jgi:hypothetical protein